MCTVGALQFVGQMKNKTKSFWQRVEMLHFIISSKVQGNFLDIIFHPSVLQEGYYENAVECCKNELLFPEVDGSYIGAWLATE